MGTKRIIIVMRNPMVMTQTSKIGNHLGNPREVVTRMLKYFQNEGLVKLSRGTIEICDKEGLKRIVEK